MDTARLSRRKGSPPSPETNMTKRNVLPDGHPCQDCDVSADALCSVLDTAALADFRNQGSTLQLAAGRPLFHQGDPADCVFSLTSGIICLYAILSDGRRQIVSFLFPGDLVGHEARRTHGLSAEAVSDATLCRFMRLRFERFAGSHGALADERYRRATSELSATQARLVMLGCQTARERLTSFLYHVYQRAGFGGRGGAKLLPLPMSRTDIADYLGLTRETVSREFTRLRKSGLIRPHSLSVVEILDPHRMRSQAVEMVR